MRQQVQAHKHSRHQQAQSGVRVRAANVHGSASKHSSTSNDGTSSDNSSSVGNTSHGGLSMSPVRYQGSKRHHHHHRHSSRWRGATQQPRVARRHDGGLLMPEKGGEEGDDDGQCAREMRQSRQRRSSPRSRAHAVAHKAVPVHRSPASTRTQSPRVTVVDGYRVPGPAVVLPLQALEIIAQLVPAALPVFHTPCFDAWKGGRCIDVVKKQTEAHITALRQRRVYVAWNACEV